MEQFAAPDLLAQLAELSPGELAALQRALADAAPTAPPAAGIPRRVPGADDAPGFAQERLWYADRTAPGSGTYNISSLVHRQVRSVDAVRRAFNEVVRRHEVLRTTFAVRDAKLVAVVAPSLDLPLPVTDLTGLPEEARGAELSRVVMEESRAPFDLEHGPLVRAQMLRLHGDEHAFLVGMHHTVCDGWSLGVFFRELDALTSAFESGEPSPLPELPLQYGDFAAWQRREHSGQGTSPELEYWKRQLAGAPLRIDLPADHPRPPKATLHGATLLFRVGRGTGAALEALARAENGTPFMVLLAGFSVLLSRYCGEDDLLVGSPIAGRTRSELEGLIGLFVNSLALRCDLRGAPTFRELVRRVREATLGAYAHQDAPFEKVVEALHPSGGGPPPSVQVAFVMQNTPDALPGDPLSVPETGVYFVDGVEGGPKLDLGVVAVPDGEDGFMLGLQYNADLFEQETAERLVAHFRAILAAAAVDPDRPAAALPMLSAAERAEIHAASLGPALQVPPEPVHERFAARAREMPDAPAVAWDGGSLSYAELDARADALARRLRSLGAGAETRVGVCVERSAELVIALLAVLKAGAAYLPLDPGYPAHRLALLSVDAGCAVVLTRAALAGHFASPVSVIAVDDEDAVDSDAAGDAGDGDDHPTETHGDPADAEDGGDAHPISRSPSPEDLAYVVYTSGSTGRPKGVMATHGALANLVAWQLAEFPLAPGERVALATPVGFDPLAAEVWPALAAGATLVPVDDETRDTPAALRPWATLRAISTLQVPTPVAEELARGAWAFGTVLRTLTTGGQPLRARPDAGQPFTLVQAYGPTEATVVSTFARVDSDYGDGSLPHVGRPVANTAAYVLDGEMRPVPFNAPGELCLAGAHLARGYLGRPAETALRFVPDPWSGARGARMYRTGDRARRRASGELEFLGRMDEQVKVRGVRVEPGEVEAALRAHPQVRDAAVALRPGIYGEAVLAGFVVPMNGSGPDAADLRRFLAERLPAPLVPSAWAFLDALPLTPHGKVDRAALPVARPEEWAAGEVHYEPPRDDVERQVAAVFAEMLDRPRVGRNADFFDLGGHSLLATRTVARLRETLDLELPLAALFQAPTVAELAARVTELRAASAEAQPAAEADPRESGARAQVAELTDEQVEAELRALLAERGASPAAVQPTSTATATASVDDGAAAAAGDAADPESLARIRAQVGAMDDDAVLARLREMLEMGAEAEDAPASASSPPAVAVAVDAAPVAEMRVEVEEEVAGMSDDEVAEALQRLLNGEPG